MRIYTRKPIPLEKACGTCSKVFPIENFRKYIQPAPNGNPYVYRRPNCRDCESTISKKQQSLIRTPERSKRNRLKQCFKITLEEWDFLFDCQGRQCAICGTSEKIGRGWCTDHDHTTGKVRGILCCNCNLILGLAKENKQVLIGAAGYLGDFEISIIKIA